MTKYRLQLRNVQNVGFSKTAIINVPVGDRIHGIWFQLAYTSGTNTIAGAAAEISEVRVKANSRAQRVYGAVGSVTGGQVLRDLNILNGTAYDCTGLPNTGDGVSFPIFFAEPWRADSKDKDALAWDTLGWETLQVEIDVAASIASAAGVAIVAYAVFDTFHYPKPQGIVKVVKMALPNGGTKFDVVTFDKIDWYQQITIYPDTGTSAALTKATFRRNTSDVLHEFTATANVALLTNNGMLPNASGRTAGIYDIVLDHDDLLGSAVNMSGARDLSCTIEAGGSPSGTTVLYVMRLGLPD